MMFSRDTTYLDPPEADECDCSLCRTGIGDGYGHDDGPKEVAEHIRRFVRERAS